MWKSKNHNDFGTEPLVLVYFASVRNYQNLHRKLILRYVHSLVCSWFTHSE